MQIDSNTTGLAAGLCVAIDKTGRERCVVVAKGTFLVGADGRTQLADTQEPVLAVDTYFGEPGASSPRDECDFAPFKLRTDILIRGRAFAPRGKSVEEMVVALELGALRKTLRVLGDRHWERGLLGLRPSPPAPFLQMPLVYERAFGGTDSTHPDSRNQGSELRNPVGVGFRKNPDSRAAEGTALPNLENPHQPLSHWRDTPQPMALGPVGRGWQPRIAYAGTYDERWLEDDYPFLPRDFDEQYFQCAPEDQQVPHLRGGEVLRCTGMSREGLLVAHVPRERFPITFRFDKRAHTVEPLLDTLLLEPETRRLILTWRASVPLGRKPGNLREVLVGHQPVRLPPGRGEGKRHFKSLAEVVAWYRSTQRTRLP